MIVLVTVKRLAWVWGITLLGAPLLPTSRCAAALTGREPLAYRSSVTLRPTLRLNSGFAARSIAHHGSAMDVPAIHGLAAATATGAIGRRRSLPERLCLFNINLFGKRRLTPGRNGG